MLKISWSCFCKTSWRGIEDALKTSSQDVSNTYDQDEYIGLDQDVLKKSSEDEDERRLWIGTSGQNEFIEMRAYIAH